MQVLTINHGLGGTFSPGFYITLTQGNMTSRKYTRILDGFLPYADALYPDDGVLLQDGARPHTSKETSRWMSKQDQKLQGRANSPNLSPSQSLWALLKQEIEKEASKSQVDPEVPIRFVDRQIYGKTQDKIMNSIS